jgi:hypothetical protein
MALKFFKVTVAGQPDRYQSILVHGESKEDLLSRVKIEELRPPHWVKIQVIVIPEPKRRRK